MVSKRAAFYEQAKRDCTVAAHYYVEDPCEESEINLAAASDVEKDASNFLEQAKASLGRWDNLYRSAIHKVRCRLFYIKNDAEIPRRLMLRRPTVLATGVTKRGHKLRAYPLKVLQANQKQVQPSPQIVETLVLA